MLLCRGGVRSTTKGARRIAEHLALPDTAAYTLALVDRFRRIVAITCEGVTRGQNAVVAEHDRIAYVRASGQRHGGRIVARYELCPRRDG